MVFKGLEMDKLVKLRDVLVALLSERSTWQGIGFLASAFISKDLGNLDWGQATFIGASLSAVLKIWPDKKNV